MQNPFCLTDVVWALFNVDTRTLAHNAGLLRTSNNEYPKYLINSSGELETTHLSQFDSAQEILAIEANTFQERPGY